MTTVSVEIDEDRVYRELVVELANRMVFQLQNKLEKEMYSAVRGEVVAALRKKTEEVLINFQLPDGRSVRDVVVRLLVVKGGLYEDRVAVVRAVEQVVATEAERIIREEVEPYAAKVREEVKLRIASVIGL
jgi:hypothetical protein